MSVRTISKLLIAFGVIMIVIALNMDTTVSNGYSDRVYNIGLVSQQQNYLILGGLAFIGGIVLFATAKLKQTPEEELNEKAETAAKIVQVTATVGTSATSTAKYIQSWWKNLDNKLGRVFTFIFCSIALSSFTEYYYFSYYQSDFFDSTQIVISSIESMFFIGFALYILRPIKASRAMKHLLMFITMLAALNIFRVLFSFYDAWEPYATSLISVAIFWGITSILVIWKIVWSERKKAMQ